MSVTAIPTPVVVVTECHCPTVADLLAEWRRGPARKSSRVLAVLELAEAEMAVRDLRNGGVPQVLHDDDCLCSVLDELAGQ